MAFVVIFEIGSKFIFGMSKGMAVVAPSGAKVYNITAGKTLPLWISGKNKKSLKNDNDFQQRIQLLQDFEFNGACQQVRISNDGYYIAAVGSYPPRLKIYSVEDLSMKCERGMDADVIQFCFLSDDYKKLALLQADRHIELHSQSGRHHRIRLPKFGRDMIYDRASAELYTAASGADIYRLNLCTGQFQESFRSSSKEGNNSLDQHADHLLVAAGGDHGIVECFDSRKSGKVGQLNIKQQVGANSVTCVKFDPNERMKLAVGTDSGVVMIYDIRSSTPLVVKDHQYELPIKDIQFQGEYCISSDSRICKIWNKETKKPFVNIESDNAINHASIIRNSGLMFLSEQKDKVEIYYIPGLGAAPFWCSFLDNLTEELEQDTQSVIYDDYKFITRHELESFGLNRLIGTPYLRAYMHGFFMDTRLYRKVFDVANPYGYKEYVQERIKKKRDEQQASRITRKTRAPKVNRFFHERYLQDLKNDDRFGAIMEKDAFEIDVNSEEYLKKHRHEQEEKEEGDDQEGELVGDAPPPRQRKERRTSSHGPPTSSHQRGNRGKRDFGDRGRPGHGPPASRPPMNKREKDLKTSLAARIKSKTKDTMKGTTRSRGISKNMEFTFVTEQKPKKTIRKY